MQIPSLVEILLAKFHGQLLIPLLDALTVIGYNQQTARNELSKKTFPIRTVLQGGRRYICITDLAGYLERLQGDGGRKSRAGRPTKASKIEAPAVAGEAR